MLGPTALTALAELGMYSHEMSNNYTPLFVMQWLIYTPFGMTNFNPLF